MSRTASVGFVTVMGREMATSQDFVNWVCGPNVRSDFLAFLLRASRPYICSLASGAVHKTVYMPTVKAFHVCLPSVEEQEAFAGALSRRMDNQTKLVARVESELAAIDALPAALLRRAFSGEQ